MAETTEIQYHEDNIGNFCMMLGSEKFHALMNSWMEFIERNLAGGNGEQLLEASVSGYEIIKENNYLGESENRDFRENAIISVILDQLRKKGICVFEEGSRIIPDFTFEYEDLGGQGNEKYERMYIKLFAERKRTSMGMKLMRAVNNAVNKAVSNVMNF